MHGFSDKDFDYPERLNEYRCAESAIIHDASFVDPPCHIGERTTINPFSHVMANAIIGDDCHIGHSVTIESGVMIGHHVQVMNNTLLMSGVILENDVYCGPSTVVTALRHVRGAPQAVSTFSPTLIRRGASIGANTTVAGGFTIGRHTFIEAGSVIDRDIPNFAMVCGNPLKLFGWRCDCGEVLSFQHEQAECSHCGASYRQPSEFYIERQP